MATISRALMQTLRPEIDAALAAVAQKHGVVINAGHGTYDPSGGVASFKLNIALPGDGVEKAEDAIAARDYDTYCFQWGLKKEWRGQSFTTGGRKFTITGLRPRATAKPILARSEDGRTFIFPADTVKLHMNAADVAKAQAAEKGAGKQPAYGRH